MQSGSLVPLGGAGTLAGIARDGGNGLHTLAMSIAIGTRYNARMKWHDKRWLLWWVFPAALAILAGVMPDTFLDSPDTTIPHEAAFILRFWMCAIASAYIGVVLVLRIVENLIIHRASGAGK